MITRASFHVDDLLFQFFFPKKHLDTYLPDENFIRMKNKNIFCKFLF